jgi:(p)ppGpp synthase/HD superfamily hydrolase
MTVPLKNNPVVQAALMLATSAHQGQSRRGGLPYITHPIAVANAVLQQRDGSRPFRDEVRKWLVVTALLHDVVEDSSYTIGDIVNSLKGPAHEDNDPLLVLNVICAVDMLTKKKGKQSYLDYILRIKRFYLASAVKIADIKHNLKTTPEGSQRDKYLLALHILQH